MIGAEVRRRREDLGLTGAQLAARAGMAPSAVSQIETGKRTPSSASVVKLAEGLGVGVGDLYPKDLSPRLPLEERGERSAEEFERTLAYVMEPVAAETLKEEQTANRFLSSEGENQNYIVDPPEAEVGRRFLEELSPEERPLAFAEVALGRARFERRAATLEEHLTRAQRLLRERDQKIARLEEENAHLWEEHEQAKVEKT